MQGERRLIQDESKEQFGINHELKQLGPGRWLANRNGCGATAREVDRVASGPYPPLNPSQDEA
jgi:hypothetical protein